MSKKSLWMTIVGGVVVVAGVSIIVKNLWAIIGTAALVGIAYGVGKLVYSMSKGLDLTTHNRQDHDRAFENLEMSGDTRADEIIAKGKEALTQIRAANDAIKDPALSRQLYDIEDKCVSIFQTVAEKPDQSFQVRKFMNYYLPTTLKIVESYRKMEDRGISAGEMAEHRATLSRGLTMISTACQRQLDNLYKDTMLDVSTDVDVLEQMLKRDAFTDGDLSVGGIAAQEKARTAAAAQLMGQEVPDLIVPGESASASGTASANAARSGSTAQ